MKISGEVYAESGLGSIMKSPHERMNSIDLNLMLLEQHWHGVG